MLRLGGPHLLRARLRGAGPADARGHPHPDRRQAAVQHEAAAGKRSHPSLRRNLGETRSSLGNGVYSDLQICKLVTPSHLVKNPSLT